MSTEFAKEPVESYELTAPKTKELTKGQIRRAQISGVVLIALAAVVAFYFVPSAEGDSTFGLSLSGEAVQLSPLAVPAQASLWLLAGVLAFLGGLQFIKGFQSKSTIIVGIAFTIFTVALMVWATAGAQFNLESMLVATVARSTPIALGALSGVLCERSGVVNIGIEGMLLGGAFTGVVIGS
ncbi:MAG: ABC transporter permease, partial [Actinomycetes bacterium]